ncbi:MAG: DEAD/DEAH box helicase family protein [Candidatus Helarchaeales archaeon]
MKLEKNLVLTKYFLGLFGFDDFNSLREMLKDTEEGEDSAGRSYFIDVLIGLRPEWEESLLKHDEAIIELVKRLRRNRRQPNFNFKYFQYLAVLFTEIFLEKYHDDREHFLNDLNDFVEKFNSKEKTKIPLFTENDLKKLAFWMATGSGKTLIMHVNYWQMLKYSKNDWDNIILITPNEGLSKQHHEELKLSRIPHKLYDGNIDNLKTRGNEILIIDIHKLTKEKKGEGVSVDISYFDGKNLVFIDEGHKGQKSEEQKWKKLREEIGKNGFLFEYSATFGQVIGKNKDLLDEYARAIIFDYSYKYFYTDGHGKDFHVYNIYDRDGLKRKTSKNKGAKYSETQRDLLLTAGLLSFYEQLMIFENHEDKLREYNIEKPLWIFVGSKVTGKGLNSDVVKVIQFLDKGTSDESYLKENIIKILEGKSGYFDEEGNDIFKDKFQFIRNFSVEDIMEGIYQKIFNGKGRIELHEIKNADGEIGLKTSLGGKYFGVINVGDVRSLKKLIKVSEIEIKEDHFSQSLFFGLDKNESPINILIGSKKFIEGWNSWRVSNMGLINMGKGEGPQIIQLFGRGIRLKGKNYSLKREENPDYKLKVVQTLFIFGLNADYINAFLTAIEKEEVDYEEISIPIKFNQPEKWEDKIYTIKTKEDFDFTNHVIKLSVNENILGNVKIDLRPKITMAHGLKTGTVMTGSDNSLDIPEEYFDLVDWDLIHSEIMNHKIVKGMFNLLIDKKTLIEIAKSRKYKIFMSESPGIRIEQNNGRHVLKLDSFEGVRKYHEIIQMVLKDYTLKFYKRKEKRKIMDYLEVDRLKITRFPSMYPEEKEIIIKIPKKLVNEIAFIKKQLQEYEMDENKIPDSWKNEDFLILHFDNHLYTPLIVWKESMKDVKSVPVRLNKGETRFLIDLRNFLNSNKNMFKKMEIFLLRNLSRRGIGFFLSSGFYPDFILWIKNENVQHLVFVDPKGIRFLGNFEDHKIQLCASFIKEVEINVNEELKRKGERDKLQLDAFIISVTPYDDIKTTFGNGRHSEEEFEEHNVIFQENAGYVRKIFKRIGIDI